MLVNMLCFGDLTMQESACIDSRMNRSWSACGDITHVICRALEAWVKVHHTNPNTRAPAYLPEIKVCQRMRDLVMEFSQEYGLHVI